MGAQCFHLKNRQAKGEQEAINKVQVLAQAYIMVFRFAELLFPFLLLTSY